MHHVLHIYFKTLFGFQLNLSSKLPLLLVEKVSLFYKSILVSKGKVFQNSLNIFRFHKESHFNPFLNSTLCKSYLWNYLKISYLSKGVTSPLLKIKSFAFSSTKWIFNQRFWLSFVLKAFDFTSRAKFLSKINLTFKKIQTDLLTKGNCCEKILLQPFKEKF